MVGFTVRRSDAGEGRVGFTIQASGPQGMTASRILAKFVLTGNAGCAYARDWETGQLAVQRCFGDGAAEPPG
jgi:hypothetical protein